MSLGKYMDSRSIYLWKEIGSERRREKEEYEIEIADLIHDEHCIVQ